MLATHLRTICNRTAADVSQECVKNIRQRAATGGDTNAR